MNYSFPPVPDAPTFLDAGDAAAVAAAILTNPAGHYNRVYHLTGPAALSMADVAVALSAALGYRVDYTHPGVLHFAWRLHRRGVGWDSIGFMSAVYTLTRLGQNQQITGDVQRLLGRAPRSLTDFLHDSAWRWHQRNWT